MPYWLLSDCTAIHEDFVLWRLLKALQTLALLWHSHNLSAYESKLKWLGSLWWHSCSYQQAAHCKLTFELIKARLIVSYLTLTRKHTHTRARHYLCHTSCWICLSSSAYWVSAALCLVSHFRGEPSWNMMYWCLFCLIIVQILSLSKTVTVTMAEEPPFLLL